MTENTRTEQTFTYALTDEYLSQTDELKRIGTWTYTGPDKLWIFIDKETKKIKSRFHYTERDNGADTPTPHDSLKIFIDATVNPLIASMIHNEVNYAELPQFEETLPDGSIYAYPDPVAPDHTYELTEIQYDEGTQQFVTPFPWKNPHRNWEDFIQMRNNYLIQSDTKFANAPEKDKAAWLEYRQILRDLPEVMKGIGPWKIRGPIAPDEVK